jgi:PLP dependent protein
MERIEFAARTSGRTPQSIKLVVVTKKQPLELIEAVIAAGAQYLGENYADEALPKINALRRNQQVQWHMIGHVQSRKAEMVCDNFGYIHSLDSLKLAERYNHFAGAACRKIPVLLQFNVSGEETKSGWNAWQEQQWEQFMPEIEKIITLENIQVRGVMTMPPFTEDPESARLYFRRLVQLRDFLGSHFPRGDWNELSMGMSGDYEVAIHEGATWVRIGQAILGPRP